MRSHYRIHEPHAGHFVTGTIIEWLPIFTTAARCNILVSGGTGSGKTEAFLMPILGALAVEGAERTDSSRNRALSGRC